MPYPVELIKELAARHGVVGEPVLMPDGGMVNEAWRIGDAVLRIVREGAHEECDTEAPREAAVVPLARSAGVRTPALIGWGLADDLAPRNYTVYEYVDGVLLGHSGRSPLSFGSLYHELGREMALLHTIEVPEDVARHCTIEVRYELARDTQACVDAGKLTASDGAEIVQWIEFLESRFGEDRRCFIHYDVHSWNLMAGHDDSLAAVLDWGDASFGHPAADLAMMPLECMPLMIEGYRDGGGVVDDGFVARALYIAMDVMLWELRNITPEQFAREWWTFPPGGWAELKGLVEKLFPELAV